MLLLLSACLIAQPATCREERIAVSAGASSPFVCLRNAQSVLARWQGEHPEWHVARWRCAGGDGEPKDAGRKDL